MALPWLPCSQRRPLVARISPKPAARPLRLPDSSGWAATAMWSAARPLRIARSPCLSALAHTSMHAPEASSAAHPLHRLPVGPRRCAARWCAGRGAVSAAAWLLALPRRCPLTAQRAGGTVAACAPAAGAHRPTASLWGGERRALTCVCGWTTLEGDGEAAATAAASSARCARITSPAAPTRASGSALAARRLPEGEPPDPSRPLCGGAAALARRRRCCLASRDVLSGIARRRLPCGNVAVCSATRRCGGSAHPLSRRPASGPCNTSAVGGARSARPCRRVLPIAPRPSPRRLPLPRRQLGERRWRSLRRTLWLHARPVGVPEAMCG